MINPKKVIPKYPCLCIQKVPAGVTSQDLFTTISKMTEVLKVRATKSNMFFFADFLTFEDMEKAYDILIKKNLNFKVSKGRNNNNIIEFNLLKNSNVNNNNSLEKKENQNPNSLKTFDQHSNPSKIVRKCINCNIEANKVCSRCRGIFYCSLMCQANNWPMHRNVCIGIIRSRNEENITNQIIKRNDEKCENANLSLTDINGNQTNDNVELIKKTAQVTLNNNSYGKIANINENFHNLISKVPQIVPKNNEIVEITEVINPALFCIRTLNDESKRIFNIIKEEAKFAQQLKSVPAVGELILVKCEKNGCNRSVVLNNEDSGSIAVYFLDYGYKGVVKLSELLHVTVPCQYLPTFCFKFSIKTIPKTLILNEPLRSYYASFTEGRRFKLICQEQQLAKTLFGELYDLQLNNEMGNVVKSLNEPPPKTYITDLEVKDFEEKVNVPLIVVENSQVQSLGAITVVHDDDYTKFKTVENKVSHLAKLIGVDPYSPGLNELCLVNMSQNGKWYRGKCQKLIDSNKREISMIDYGITAQIDVSNIRAYPLNLKDPIITYECDIAGIPNDISIDLGKRLKDMVEIGTKIVAKRLIKHGKTNLGYIIIPTILDTLMLEDLLS